MTSKKQYYKIYVINQDEYTALYGHVTDVWEDTDKNQCMEVFHKMVRTKRVPYIRETKLPKDFVLVVYERTYENTEEMTYKEHEISYISVEDSSGWRNTLS